MRLVAAVEELLHHDACTPLLPWSDESPEAGGFLDFLTGAGDSAILGPVPDIFGRKKR